MSINAYEDTLERLAQSEAPAVIRAPANPYLDTIREQDGGREQALRSSLVQADETTPDAQAEILGLSQRTGLPPDLIGRNLDKIRTRATIADTPYAQMLRESPVLTTWISEPANAALAQDDLEPLGALEWILTAPQRAFRRGQAQVELSQLRVRQAMGETLTAAEHAKAAELKAEMQAGGELGAGSSWFRRAVRGAAQQLPILGSGIASAAERGIPFGVTAGTAAALAGQLGPQVAAPEEIVTVPVAFAGGLTAGMLAGGAEFGFRLEAGLAFDEFLDFTDELGQPIDPDVARAAALGAGAINAGLEAVGIGVLLKTLPGASIVTRAATRQQVRAALRSPTVRAALGAAVKTYGATLTKEASIEVAQRAVTIFAGEAGKVASGQDIPGKTPSEVAGELGQEFVGGLEAFVLLALPGPTATAVVDSRRARTAQQNTAFFQALGEGIAESKTAQRLPAAAQQFIEQATKDGPIPVVYAPIDTWTTYWQDKGLDPAQVAAELTGLPDAYETATRTGEDLAIPTSAYAVKLAATEHNAFLASELRLGPAEMNAREAAAFLEAEQAAAAATAPTAEGVTSSNTPDTTAIRDALVVQLEAAGVERSTAETYATLYEQAFGSIAERAGVDPAQLFERYGLEVTRAELPTEGDGRMMAGDGRQAADPAGRLDLRDHDAQPGAADPSGDRSGGGRPARAVEGRALAVPAQARPHFDALLADARSAGFTGSDDQLADAYLEAVDQARAIAADVADFVHAEGTAAPDLLRAIAAAGGLGINAERGSGASGEVSGRAMQGGMVGELEALLEEFEPQRFTRKRKGQSPTAVTRLSGDVAGIRGVVKRTGGRPLDAIREALEEDPRWQGKWENLGELLEDIRAAIGEVVSGRAATVDTEAVAQALKGALGVKAGTRWWETELGQGPLFDVLDTGEVQPRLPGAENVRDQEVALPPIAPVGDTFELTPPPETDPTQTSLFQSAVDRLATLVPVGNRGAVAVPHQSDLATSIRVPTRAETLTHGAIRRVPIVDLIATQDRIDPQHVRALVEGTGEGRAFGAERPVAVERADGSLYLVDGQHRVAAAWASEATTIEVQVVPEATLSGTPTRLDVGAPRDLFQVRRGRLRFGADRQMRIDLFAQADLSTFLHETGHFLLEVMGDVVDALPADPGVTTDPQKQLTADYGALLTWLGVESREQIGVEQHEQLARGFEAYLMEGQAPSLALRQAFARFRAWMIGVYRSLRGLNVELTPQVRRVFDRLIASDRAIAEAEAAGRVDPMFLSADQAGMTEREFAAYTSTVADASRTARERLDRRLLAEVQREQEADWKARREIVEQAVTADVHSRPVYQALAAMQRGTKPDGSPLLEGLEEPQPVKLSKAILVERYGAARLTRLPRPYLYSVDGGMDPDIVADMFDFSSGDELLTAVEQAIPMKAAIAQETDRRMLAEHGSLLLDGTLLERAQEAIGNEDRETVIRAELRALWALQRTAKPVVAAALDAEQRERAYERRWFEAEAKLRIAIAEGHKQSEIDALTLEVRQLRSQARSGAVTIRAALPRQKVIDEAARVRIAGTRVRELTPAVFWSASRRAARQATEAAARQKFDVAIKAKQQELLNVALYRAATAARDDVAARVARVKALNTPAARQRLGLAGQTYLDQVDGILDRFSFATVSQKALDRRSSLDRWVTALEAEGLPVDLPDELLEEQRRTPYQELTVEALVGVTDGIQQIVHLARLKNRLLKAKDKRELAELISTITTSIREKAQPRAEREGARDRGPSTERRRTIGSFFASHRKLASLAREMDGFEDGGPMWDHIIRPLNEAADTEAEMNAAATKALGAVVQSAFPGRERGTLYVRQHVPAIGRSLSKMERLMVALNWGNEGNRQRIRAGEGWTEAQAQAVLDTLDARDWAFVQGVWDLIDGYWSDIAAKQRRVTGLAPAKVEASPVATRFGTFTGGYFPIKYDNRLSATAAAHLDLDAGLAAKQAAYVKASTRRGHTKERQAKGSMKVRLDFGVLTEHLQQVIHDLSHHEALIDVGRVLQHKEVQAAIFERYGDQVYQQFKDGLRDVAFGDVPATHGFEAGLSHVRKGATIAGLGWNLTTAMLQPLGLTQSMVRIGPRWVAKGLTRWLRNAASMERTVDWITDRSSFMRLRGQTQQREINEIRNTVGLNTGKFSGWVDDAMRGVTLDVIGRQSIVDSYFYLIQQMQRIADVPTWLGAYEKAMAAGETEARAIALSDQAVIDAQAGGQIKDLAAVQRGGPPLKLWTNFYSFFNTTYNLTVESAKRTNYRSPADVGRLAVDFLLLYTVPASLGYLVRAALKPGDDDEDLVEGLVRENLGYMLGTLLGVRELSGTVQGYYGYQGPAGARAFAAAGRFIGQVEQGKLDAAFWRSFNEAAGIYFHYPAGQVRRTFEGILALADGRTSNPAAVVTGAAPEGR